MSFSVRLELMLTEKLHIQVADSFSKCFEANTYSLKWKHCSTDDPPDISDLPSVDHALYLFHTVKFHLGHHYRSFNDREFIDHVHQFYYGNALEKATESRLWFVQFLLVLAFGTAFLSKSSDPQEPPGAKYFVRAMSLMPDHTSIWKESCPAIEALALAGLYLYSIDQREVAHVYVSLINDRLSTNFRWLMLLGAQLGQALRIAQFEGIHTMLPEEELGLETVTRCRNLWWTLYIMDRHFSTSLGLPTTTADCEITVPVSSLSTDSQDDSTLSLQVKLSHLLSVIVTSKSKACTAVPWISQSLPALAIYKAGKTQLGVFLETIRSTLRTMAGHAQEIEDIVSTKFRNSVKTMPRVTRHITLLYHQVSKVDGLCSHTFCHRAHATFLSV